MSDETINYMTVQEFRDKGFLQELNRRFLHPAGMALSVIVDDETGEVSGFGPIWDYRDDPVGLTCPEFSRSRTLEYQRLVTEKAAAREQKIGRVIQRCDQP